MKFLALSHVEDGADESELVPLLAEEAARAWRHYLDGFVREAYFRPPPAAPGAILIVEAEDEREAARRLDLMPLRVAGLIRFEVMPMGPFLPWALLVGDEQPAAPVSG